MDTTVRKVVIGNLPFLLSDTVGFIRKLPTQLIESFKSTLDEVRDADLLLHVVDISHPNFEEHIASVNQILGEIQSINKPTIMVFNKIDAYTHQTIDQDDLMTEKTSRHFTLEEWKQTWMNRMNGDAIFISAVNKENIQEFREKVYKKSKGNTHYALPLQQFLISRGRNRGRILIRNPLFLKIRLAFLKEGIASFLGFVGHISQASGFAREDLLAYHTIVG